MMSWILNMKLKNFLFLILCIVTGVFMIIYYGTGSKLQGGVAKIHKHQMSLDNIYIEDVLPDVKVPSGLLFDASFFDKHKKLQPNISLPSPQRIPSAQDLLLGVPESVSIFTTNKMPSNTRQYPYVGNGHIATVVESDSVYMNGLYNGLGSSSHRARIPSMVALKLNPAGPYSSFRSIYSLDVGQGIFNETITTSYFEIEKLIYAHRAVKELIVVDIRIRRFDIGIPLVVHFSCNHGSESEDIEFFKSAGYFAETTKMKGFTKQPEISDGKSSPVHVIYTNIPKNFTFTSSLSEWAAIFMMSISSSEKAGHEAYEQGLHLIKINSLLRTHTSAWAKLWKEGRVDIEGDSDLAQMNYASLYYLLSSLPLVNDPISPFVGLSPCGLSNGGKNQEYWGHVMWDQEIWMFPPILLLYEQLSRIVLSSRTLTLSSAEKFAASTGYTGARFPWETAATGVDVTVSKNCSLYEQHVSGDISLAFRQHLYALNDTEFLLNSECFKIIKEVADFWVSRAKLDKKTGLYVIDGVMGPDEYHYPVNNSVYTNAVARESIELACYVHKLLKKTPPAHYNIAEKIYLPFDETLKYHPQYDGYKVGTQVKQADVALLGYPVQLLISEKSRFNDLLIYEKVVSKTGPAMSFQNFAINWFDLNNRSRALSNFNRWKHYSNGPFRVWSEMRGDKGCVNFLTGIGGYMQSVLHGMLGFRIHKDHMTINPVLINNISKIGVTGVDYLRNSFDVLVTEKTIKILLTSSRAGAKHLKVTVKGQLDRHLLANIPLTVKRQCIFLSPL